MTASIRRVAEEVAHTGALSAVEWDEVSSSAAQIDQHLAALIESRTALFARLQRIDELAAAVDEIDSFLSAEAEDASARTLEPS